jgi:hypothetical protein
MDNYLQSYHCEFVLRVNIIKEFDKIVLISNSSVNGCTKLFLFTYILNIVHIENKRDIY